MDELSEKGREETPGVALSAGGTPEPAAQPEWTSPMPLSMPPYVREADTTRIEPPHAEVSLTGQEPTREHDPWLGAGPTTPGSEPPGAPGAPPTGGQPPFPPLGSGWPPGGPPPSGPTSVPAQPRRHRAMAALGVVALVAGGLGAGLGIALGGTSSGSGSGTTSNSGSSLSGGGTALSSTGTKLSVSSIAAEVEPAIVDIQTNVASPSCDAEQAAGTGMIISSSGEILTNNHVVEDATSIKVTIAKHSGTYDARVIGVNPTKDVALLQVEGVSHLPYVSFANSSSVALGDSVVAIGNAEGLEGTPTVVSGAITALGRTITASDEGSNLTPETLHGLLQTNAQIQPGDSGGPLLDSAGKVIGMDTAALTDDSNSATIGFAIPINAARTIVAEMQKGEAVGGNVLGSSPFLGVYEDNGATLCATGNGFGGIPGFGGFANNGSTQPATTSGVTIAGVVASSPAAKAGLEAGDVITSIDGTATPSWAALQKVIQAKVAGDSVTITYVNVSGTSEKATVVLTSLPK